MRAILVLSLVAVLGSAAALAQTAPASPSASPAAGAAPAVPAPATPSAAPAKGGDIMRAEYVDRAVERARRAAEKRFDRMDTNHDGVLSADERRAAHAARAQRHAASSQ